MSNIALIGFGEVGKSFIKLLQIKKDLLPKNTKLKIDEKRPVILNIDSEQRSFKTINEIQDYFNSTGRLKYDTTKTEFIIYATKFNPESKISLSYYYTK